MSEPITGTREPKVDVPAVQGAVDDGGDVVLAGHFDFGPMGNVTVPFLGIRDLPAMKRLCLKPA